LYMCREVALRWREAAPALPQGEARGYATARGMLIVVAVAVFAQIVLGALIRHTGASGAAGVGWNEAIIGTDPNTGTYALLPTYAPALINVLHRYAAVPIAIMIALCCVRLWQQSARWSERPRSWLVFGPIVLVLLQGVIGVVMLGT